MVHRLLAVLPWCFWFGAVARLTALYPYFPERWPSHWNAAGQIDGWSSRTPLGAGFPLLMALGLVVLLEGLAWWAGRLRVDNLPEPWPRRLAEANQDYFRYISACLVLFLAYLACSLPFGRVSWFAPAWLLGACVLYPIVSFYSMVAEMRREGALPPGYRGLVYANPEDPRVWVPKLGGMGATLNFAHGRAWLWMALFLGVPLGIGLMVALAAIR